MSEYVLYIKSDVSGGSYAKKNNSGSEDDSINNEGTNTDFSSKAIGTYFATKIAAPVVKSAFNFATSKVNMYTGSQDKQDKINFALQTAQDVGTVVSGAIIGGLAFGPIGAVVGGLAGAVGIAIGYGQRAAEFNYTRSWNDAELSILRERSGGYSRSRR